MNNFEFKSPLIKEHLAELLELGEELKDVLGDFNSDVANMEKVFKTLGIPSTSPEDAQIRGFEKGSTGVMWDAPMKRLCVGPLQDSSFVKRPVGDVKIEVRRLILDQDVLGDALVAALQMLKRVMGRSL